MKEYTMMFDSDKKFSLSDPSRNTYMEDLIVYNLTTTTDAVHEKIVTVKAMTTTRSFSKCFPEGRGIRMPVHGFDTTHYMQAFYDNITRRESDDFYKYIHQSEQQTMVSIDLDSLYSLINHPK